MATAPAAPSAAPEHAFDLPLLASRSSGPSDRRARLMLLLLWVATTTWLAAHHAVWRDEVRALTLATSGDSVWHMLWAIHGEGHPALWYLMLRGGFALTGSPVVLPAIAYAVAMLATAVFTVFSPFRPWFIALVLSSAFALVDYVVVARNYGIAMLLMFVIILTYKYIRGRGITLGALLFLLCNTNAVAVLLAGGVILFWGIELYLEEGWRWTPKTRNFALNGALAFVGVIACAATVYPPHNDAVALAVASESHFPLSHLAGGLGETVWGMALFVAMLLGSVIALVRAPAALISAIAMIAAAILFFRFVYPGAYRHQALVLVFLLGMYWLALNERGGRWPKLSMRWDRRLGVAQRYGAVGFAGLLALQTLTGLALAERSVRGQPFSRSQDLGRLLHRPAFRDAIVIGDPDVMLEPLSFYAPNPTYFVRERRWSRTVDFTRAAMRDVSLGELLATARLIHVRYARPVLIVLKDPLDPTAGARRINQGYLGTFSTTPVQVAAFLAETRSLVAFPPAQTDESYTVYLLR